MTVHKGHRQRLRDRFRDEGLDNFADHEVMELLLFYCIPRQNTNPIAHRLIEKFGSLSQVLDATPEELMGVEGVGEAAALFLATIPQVGRRYMIDKVKNEKILATIEDCGRYLLPYFCNRTSETLYMLCLDSKCKVICCKHMGEGGSTSMALSVRNVVKTALSVDAASVVLAHNHPSGLAIPSGEDIQTTLQLASALETVGISLADHLVVADDDFVSMAQSGYYRPGRI